MPTVGLHLASENILISLCAGKWSIPTTTGPRPPPCADFTFTAVSDHLAVLFGGYQPGRRSRVNDCYVMNLETMVCPEVFCQVWKSVQHMQGRQKQITVGPVRVACPILIHEQSHMYYGVELGFVD